MIEALASFASTVLVGLLSAWVGVLFSLKRYRSEKWWEKKVEAYERIINALHATKNFNDKHFDAGVEGEKISDVDDQKLMSEAEKGHNEILRTIDIGSFLLPESSVNRLKQFAADVNKINSEAESWDEYLDRDWKVTKECLEDLKILAKRDLKID
ncbi:hypothetical protein [Vreelandella maris]|uniref:DUF4760 domain-containing protein n=1 Tax=Vreelandella maris TaxID=2729617 RepID=A0A7Y6RDI8_9GAMM|nr:hypothetical protein [Halomonas maris]NVF14989.1 hypothetical protein [Halomonas maris]